MPKSNAAWRIAIALPALVLFGAHDAEATSEPYLEALIAQSEALDLEAAPAWRALVHYRPDWIGSGDHSLIDSPGFFLAADGKIDPAAELEATLRAFFDPPTDDETLQHPQCAFVARYRWLKEQLQFAPERLEAQPCPRFEAWSTTIGAAGATLIFPARLS